MFSTSCVLGKSQVFCVRIWINGQGFSSLELGEGGHFSVCVH